MADNFNYPVRGGSTDIHAIATDDVGGAHYIRIKLDGGGDGAAAPVLGDTAFGLDVDVTRLPALSAGTENIGDVDVITVPAPLSTTGGGTEATALRVTIANNSTGLISIDDGGGSISIDDGGGSITVDGPLTDAQLRATPVPISGTVSISGSVDTELPPAAALSDGTGNPSVPGVGTFLHGFDGTDWERLRCDATTRRLEVEVENNPVLGASTANIGDVDILTFAAGLRLEVEGDVAPNTAIAGNPLTGGSEARSSDPSAVSTGTAVRHIADLLGKQIVQPYAIPERLVDGAVAAAMAFLEIIKPTTGSTTYNGLLKTVAG